MARHAHYCVFRVVNEARKEIYLVATSRPIFDAIVGLRDERPRAIKDWDLDDIAKFESLEFNLSKDAAMEFVNARVNSGTRRGYRYILALEFEPARRRR